MCRIKEAKCQKSIFLCACPRLHPMNALYEWQGKWHRHFAPVLPHFTSLSLFVALLDHTAKFGELRGVVLYLEVEALQSLP